MGAIISESMGGLPRIQQSAGSNRSFWRSSRGLLIAVPNADDPPSGNHESLQSKIPKRKKLRPHNRLSCKIEYFIQTTSADLSGRSAFFTDDFWEGDRIQRVAMVVSQLAFEFLALRRMVEITWQSPS